MARLLTVAVAHRWLKVAGALLLVACYVLPMKSCTEHVDEAGKRVSVLPGEAPAAGVRSITTRYYLVEELRADDPWTWLVVSVFAGPAAIAAYTRRRPAARLAKILWFAEPLVLAGVAFSVWYITFLFSDPDVGCYVAAGGIAIYLLGWIGEAGGKWRSWRRLSPG